MDERIERQRKPRKCPSCGKSPVATILYGLPAYDDEMQQQIDSGLIKLGGCCVMESDPAWHCTHCDIDIYRKTP